MSGSQRKVWSWSYGVRAVRVLALAIALSGGPVFGQTTFPALGNISGVNAADLVDTGNETNPRIATDGAGNILVVVQSDESGSELAELLGFDIDAGSDLDIWFMFSSDGGDTWSERSIITTDALSDGAEDADTDPQVATDANGTWLVAWQAADADTSEILWTRSTDDAATWSAPAALIPAEDDVNPAGADYKPHLATDGAGTWIIVWTSTRDIDGDLEAKDDPEDPDVLRVTTDEDIFYAISTDNAETFGPVMILNAGNVDDTEADTSPSIATDKAGNWMVIWETGEELVFTRSQSDGAIWSVPLPLPNAAGSNPCLVNDGARESTGSTTWFCIWQADGISVSRYLESDTPEEHEEFLPEGEVFDEWLEPITIADSGTNAALAIDATGRWIATWEDDDVLAALSIDVGRTWTDPTAVDPEGDPAGTAPQAVSGTTDEWLVLWSSTKDRAGAGSDADLFTVPFTFGIFQDCNANSIADADDIATGTSEDCNGNGIPDECGALEADNDGDGIIDACDDTPFGEDTDANDNDAGDDNANDNDSDNGNDNEDVDGGDTIDGPSLPCAAPVVGGLLLLMLFGIRMRIANDRRRDSR